MKVPALCPFCVIICLHGFYGDVENVIQLLTFSNWSKRKNSIPSFYIPMYDDFRSKGLHEILLIFDAAIV